MRNQMLSKLALLFLTVGSLHIVSAQTRMISHVTRDGGGFATIVHIENTSGLPQTYQLNTWDESGAAQTPVTGEIAPYSTAAYAQSELFAETSVSHFAVSADDAVQLSVSYATAQGESTPAHVRESDEQASTWRLFAGNWNIAFDGVAVVNAGAAPTSVWVHQRNNDGAIVASARITDALAPNAKTLYIIGDPNTTTFDLSQGTIFDIAATQPLAITSLRGSLTDPLLFWSNEAAGLNHARSTRDEQSVWFIEDGSLADVHEMMGYEVAVDRLWQIEIFRREANGTMAEIFGATFVNTDALRRAMGYTQEELEAGFQNLSEDGKIVLKAYAAGINRRIAEIRADQSMLPWEFSQVNLSEVQEWTAHDVMAWYIRMQRLFSPGSNPFISLIHLSNLANLQARFGAEQGFQMFDDVYFTNDPDAPTVLPQAPAGTKSAAYAKSSQTLVVNSDLDLAGLNEAVQNYHEGRELEDQIGGLLKGGSFAWVIAGSKTASGNPIVHGGPQLEFGRNFAAPSFVMEGSIRGGGLEVSGLVIPGIPAILIGRTPNHTWSLQSGDAAANNTYIESFATITPTRVEVIKVAGGSEVQQTMYTSPHGPVINPSPLISWNYANRDIEMNMIDVTLAMARATTMEAFGDAITAMGASFHVTYADTQGNIAYWHTGLEPNRPEGEWRLPVGSTGGPILEWDEGFVPQIHDANPESGFYAGWNTKVHPEFDDVTGLSQYGPYWRSTVIKEWLESHDNITFEQANDLALNIGATQSGPGGEGNPYPIVKDTLIAAVEADNTPERQAAIDLLEGYTGHFVAGGEDAWVNGADLSDQWVLFETWFAKIMNNTLEELTPDEFGTNTIPFRFNFFLHAFLDDSQVPTHYDWFQNADESMPQTRDAIIIAALDETLQELGPQPWGEGARFNTVFSHVFLGDMSAINPAAAAPHLNRSNYSMTVEIGANGPTRIGSMFTLGQSGEILSDENGNPVLNQHYTSMMEFFGSFMPREFPLFD